MISFGEMANDAAALKRGLELYTDFARRNPQAGLYYRGVIASLPYDQFHQHLQTLPKPKDDAHRKQLENLDALKLAASDRVVLVNWMMDYSILVRVRDGKATVAGLAPTLPKDAFVTKLIADNRSYRQVRDVVYGRSYGAALTLDVLTPIHGANGAAVIYFLSGDFVSQPMPESDNWVLLPLLSRGYTVITVVHGGLPKYTITEIVRDANRAVRFTRFHARDYGIDPNRLGVTGSSSGGYLSLMLATAGDKEPPLADESDPLGAPDAIDAISSKVQAAGCYFPPTDWLDYGEKGKCILDVNWAGPPLQSIFEFRDFDKARFAFVTIKDRARVERLLSDLSPARRVTKSAAPTLILHGEKDPTVPLQQSQLMIERLKAAGVPAELVVKSGAAHGWPDENHDMDAIVQWFDQHLPRPH
jgi:acetyl esterase/lipase